MRRAVAAATGMVVLAAGLGVLIATRHTGDHARPAAAANGTSTTPAPSAPAAWNAALLAAFGGSAIVPLLQDVIHQYDGWAAGSVSDAVFRQVESSHLAEMEAVRDHVAVLPPFPGDPLPADLYARSADLEVEWVRLVLDTADVPAGPARQQLARMARRVRELADRVFDRGRAVVDAHLPPAPTDPNVVVDAVPAVPQWAAEHLGVGPPLDAAPAAPPAPARDATRPSGPRAAWAAAVAAAAIPSPPALAGAIYADDAAACQSMARALVAAADTIGAAPDPVPAGPGRPATEGGEEAARLRLGLLIDADAARAAQLAEVVRPTASDPAVADRLIASGQRLLVVGEGLWSADLGPHTSSLNPSILGANGR